MCLPDPTFETCPTSKHFQMTKFNASTMIEFAFKRVEKFVGKGENYFFTAVSVFFPQYFQKASFSSSFDLKILWYVIKLY